MAQNTFRKTYPKTDTSPAGTQTASEGVKKEGLFNFLKDRRLHLMFGFGLIFMSFFMSLSIISFLFTGKADQSVVEAFFETHLREAGRETENWLGLLGAIVAYIWVYKGFGICSLFFVPVLLFLGFRIVFQKSFIPIRRLLYHSTFLAFWTSMTFGYITSQTRLERSIGFLGGGIGYEMALILQELIGVGTILFLVFFGIGYMVFAFDIKKFRIPFATFDPHLHETADEETLEETNFENKTQESSEKEVDMMKDQENAIAEESATDLNSTEDYTHWEIKKADAQGSGTKDLELTIVNLPPQPEPIQEPKPKESNLEMLKKPTEDLSNELLEKYGPYDPRLDLSEYRFPTIDLLKEYSDSKGNMVTKEELEENKNNIVQTLADFGIGITKIHATIGPTVTLYEIIPDAGIKISKIANLSDDIALRLSALGVRIIAPMPGKGTIGIEVPNKNKLMVPAKDILQDEKFLNAKMELPIAFGKTISNEVFVEDLTKMPHLLMAGATGMGKSVGINILLASLLYKKHPSELKIVMVDPKKVELSLYNKIERHFLAKLPDAEEAILTDTKKVIHTLNSLCIEMDTRYSLLKEAGCRNLKEYNPKFVSRKLNPNEGHRYLPYIVVVIDELADLMITAGKEIETPIARLAQLARAVGIHLVLATQRPSVNVITGLIKANFPARLSFRVTSKIDSKIILDEGGADQLIGKGDMLLKLNSDTVRLQCGFLDTPEVENIVDFIGEQRGYASAYPLPEYFDENGESGQKEVDLSNRDPKFEEAARIVVAHQQGSTSLIQRKLALGYARSGRIMDQLEAAGIVGPPNGSKVREVLVRDEINLSEKLSELS